MFNKSNDNFNFDKDFSSYFTTVRWLVILGFVFSIVVYCAVLGGIGFLVYKLMEHFGVL